MRIDALPLVGLERSWARLAAAAEGWTAQRKRALEETLHPVFSLKRLVSTADGEGIRRIDRQTCVSALAGAPASQPARVTAIQLFFDDFAVARIDDWRTPDTTILTLMREADGWWIVGAVSVEASQGLRCERFDCRTAAPEVLSLLAEYYEAVERGDDEALRRVFGTGWEMKNHEDGRIVAEDTETFLRRWVVGKPVAGYTGDRQVADVQVCWDRLAWVRIDKPSGPVVTVFTFLRVGGRWWMIDKGWSEHRSSGHPLR